MLWITIRLQLSMTSSQRTTENSKKKKALTPCRNLGRVQITTPLLTARASCTLSYTRSYWHFKTPDVTHRSCSVKIKTTTLSKGVFSHTVITTRTFPRRSWAAAPGRADCRSHVQRNPETSVVIRFQNHNMVLVFFFHPRSCRSRSCTIPEKRNTTVADHDLERSLYHLI